MTGRELYEWLRARRISVAAYARRAGYTSNAVWKHIRAGDDQLPPRISQYHASLMSLLDKEDSMRCKRTIRAAKGGQKHGTARRA